MSKPEAGLWWDSNSIGRFRVLGKMNNGFWAIDDNSDEPDLVTDEFFSQCKYLPQCNGFDWKQPAEDPDNWVILDPVKYADHVPRVGIDQFQSQSAGRADEWITQREDHSSETVGEFFEATGSRHRCRRRHLPKGEHDWTEDFEHENGNYQNKCSRCNVLFKGHKRRVMCKSCDLPKVEQVEQWPKYYRTKQPSPVVFIRRDNNDYCTVFNNVGGHRKFIPWCYGDEGLPEITEAEAMALLKKPEQWPKYWKGPFYDGTAFVRQDGIEKYVAVEFDGSETKTAWSNEITSNDATEITEAEAMVLLNKPEPQPQKTRVRLWISAVDGNVYFGESSKLRTDCEIHYDSETKQFYVENQP